MQTNQKKHPFIHSINWIFNIGIIAVISSCFYRLNQITGYTGDDFLYHFIYRGEWPTKQLSAIHNIFEWILSTVNQTQMWNGRFVAQSLVQLFMQFPKEIFNIANTIAFIIVGLLINLIVRKRIQAVNPIYLLGTYCAMFFFLPDFGRAVLWLSGSFNYLWMPLIYLGYFWFLRWQYLPRKHTGLFTVFIILLAFLTGATNENIGPVFIILTYFYYVCSANPRIKQYTYPCTFSCLAGFILLITHNTGEAASEKGQAFQIKTIIQQLIQYDGILLTIAISLILILSIQNHFRKIDLKSDIMITGLLTAGALASVGALILSPQIPPRTYFGSVILLITACLVGLNRLIQLTKLAWIIPIGCGFVISCCAFQRYTNVYPHLLSNYERFYTAEQIALKAQKTHRNTIFVPGMNDACSYSAYHETAYLEAGNDPDVLWENTWMAKYYGLKHVYLDNQIKIKSVPSSLKEYPWVIRKIQTLIN